MLSDRMGPLSYGRLPRQPALIEGSRVKLQWDSHTRTEQPQHTELRAFNLLAHIEFVTSIVLTLCLLFQILDKTPHVPVGFVVAGGAFLILTSISLHSTTWVTYGRRRPVNLRMRKKMTADGRTC